jgi:hypothetical protein
MPAECAFILPGGRKCRCMATRNHPFCRHHGAPPSGKPRRDPDRWSRLACWRDFGRTAAKTPKPETVLQAMNVLESLRGNRISDRTAGRLLRIYLQRWDELPLVPAPETGWDSGDPAPSTAYHPAPPARPPAPVPLANRAAPTLEQVEQYAKELYAKIGAGRR